MYTGTIIHFLALNMTANAALIKRDNPFVVDAFRNSSPLGSVEIDEAKAGLVAELKLDCGTVVVTSNTNVITQCDFKLSLRLILMIAVTLADGVSTSKPAAGRFSLSIPKECAGIQVGAGNRCTGCGEIGEIPNLVDCNGDWGGGKNVIDICTFATELFKCGDEPRFVGGPGESTTCIGTVPCIKSTGRPA
ncbi:hypothetical protein DL98DRAFT_536565 [Cadophora sp. DSE1049]|nr:hypothetical protein DL98DRAFT_536565 [Cadophora sp. DSE1049]